MWIRVYGQRGMSHKMELTKEDGAKNLQILRMYHLFDNVYLEIRGYLEHSDIRKHCPFRDFIVWIRFCVMLTLIDRTLEFGR